MAFPAFEYISPVDYLAIETRAERKHEYFEGRIYAMAGASLDHNIVVSNLSRKIGIFLDNTPCNLFGSDLRITTPSSDSYMYPDLSIICNDIQIQDNSFDTVTNPSVIIEVLSPSTRGFDIAFKFHYYKQIPSLKEYILIDSTQYFVQINKRINNDLWEKAVNIEDVNSSFLISAIDMQISVKDIYNRVSFTNDK